MSQDALNFEYTSYSFDEKNKKAVFKYAINLKNRKPLEFTDEVIMPVACRGEALPRLYNDQLNSILQSMHIMLGISYYKLYVPPKIKLNKPLSKEQANFFNIVYKKGLGEFCYRNKLDPKIIAKFPYDKTISPPFSKGDKGGFKENKKILLGIAGGKDSIAAGELLKQQGESITGFVVDTHNNMPIPQKIAKIMGVKMLKIKHTLDEKMYNNPSPTRPLKGRELLNEAYSGHIPFSAVLAFISIFAAYLYNYDYIAMANEYSANFGNLKYKGNDINHQWSKSSEFEEMFQNYVKNFIISDITYFSAIRPFYEIRTVEIFSKYKKYFPYFASCNENFKRQLPSTLGNVLWCGNCPKCAFVFTILAPFISKKELLSIFKKNLFEDKNLIPLFYNLLGLGKLKPFDCVGTFDEMRSAFAMASKKYKETAVMKNFSESLIHCKNEVFKTQPAPNLPEEFKFLGLKNALILGYGKEGRSIHKYLKNKYPNLKISLADQKDGKNYLEKQNNFDIVIKSPGLPERLITRPYTTPTNIFFSEIRKIRQPAERGGIKTIGITGSKGKSTTASLIYAILKEAEKNTLLLGNIGNPMIEAIEQNKLPRQKDATLVLELSSYQLDDIKFSPNIAVVLNLFPDHIPYHGNIENYYNAKKNIINFQTDKDIFIYNSKNKKLCEWANDAKAKTIPFSNFENREVSASLLGEHNQENIKAAIATVKLFNIPDETIKKAIKKFKPLRHRLELLGEFNGIKFYDDSISTAPESAIAAIKALKNIGTIILGGEDRGYDFTELEKVIHRHKIKNIILFPETGNRILKSKKGLNVLETSSMRKAVEFAYKNSPKGTVCLLSPASPSHNLWKNFEERGEEFRKEILKFT